ncbi:MAG: hypothetical protein AAF639_38155, partial [Chloroflexota bacterium]
MPEWSPVPVSPFHGRLSHAETDSVMLNGARNVPMMGRKGVAFHADVLNVIESDELFAFFECY